MERTIIDNIGKGVESDTGRRRALGIGGLSEDADFTVPVLDLQREMKLCLRWEGGLVLRSKPSSSSSSSESFLMPKNLTVGSGARGVPRTGVLRGMGVSIVSLSIRVGG